MDERTDELTSRGRAVDDVIADLAAKRDADGFYFIVGRKKDLIITGGMNIYPEDVNGVLRSIPGVGQILALVILYEVHDVRRFPRVQDFSSYARLIRPVKESDGKWAGHTNKKIGNHHLKWATKEAVIMFLRDSSQAKAYVARYERKYNKGKALGIFTHKLGRSIYFMLKNKEAFNMKRFFAQ